MFLFCFVPSLVEIDPMILVKNFCQGIFSILLIISPLRKGFDPLFEQI